MDSARQADPRPRAALAAPTAPPAAAWLRRAGCSGQRRHSVRPLRAQGADGSFDEGSLDYKLAKELDTASWSVRKAAVTKHLELLYQASQSQSEVRAGHLATGSPSPVPAGWGCRRRRSYTPPAPAPSLELLLPPAAYLSSALAFPRAAQQGGAVRALRRHRRVRVRLVPRHRQAGLWRRVVLCMPVGLVDAAAASVVPAGCSASRPSRLAPCRRHDHRRRALLQRGRLRPLPRVPRHGEWLRV